MNTPRRLRPSVTVTVGVIAAAASLLAALAAGAAGADDATFTSTRGLGVTAGAQIYSHICQGCHMPHGQGATGAGYYPKLAGDASLASWRYLVLTVLRGKNDMPPFGLSPGAANVIRTVHLSDAQVAEVANYVETQFGNHFPHKVTMAEVAALRRGARID
jgi:mono/diheme cytochrome c family protein